MSIEQRPYVSYFRPEIDGMSGYTPGEQPKMSNLLKLNTNESPFPPAPGVKKVLQEFDFTRLRLYPNAMADDLRGEIAMRNGVTAANVIAGNGSDDILNIVIRCFCDANHPVAFLEPSYSLYPTLAKLQGAPVIRIPLVGTDFSMPDDILGQAKDANLLIITRPNAPTGNSFPKDIMHDICAKFNGIVMIDEAYADFADDNCMEFATEFSNVIIARTFSKSRCLAGLRFGFAIAHSDIVYGLMKMKDSYNVSMLSQALAMASLIDDDYFAKCIRNIRATRTTTAQALTDSGFRVNASQTNFLFASPADGNAENYFHRLREAHIVVRYFPGPVTGKYVRITIGTDEQMERLLTVTKGIYSK